MRRPVPGNMVREARHSPRGKSYVCAPARYREAMEDPGISGQLPDEERQVFRGRQLRRPIEDVRHWSAACLPAPDSARPRLHALCGRLRPPIGL
jgi:hypothetical protein